MDSKILFIIGVLIIMLSTCSVDDAAPAESRMERQVLISPVCAVTQECPDALGCSNCLQP